MRKQFGWPTICDRVDRRLVFTNGMFDLLHAGHIAYLAAARDLGDVLLVGLNSDQSTRLLKGPGRPLVPETDRAVVLLALRAVDGVVVFDEPTAGALIRALRPDIYVKGGDYSLSGSGAGTPLPEEPDSTCLRRRDHADRLSSGLFDQRTACAHSQRQTAHCAMLGVRLQHLVQDCFGL